MVSFYRPEVLSQSWNKVIDNNCVQQDICAINGIPTYYPVELTNSFDIILLHQLLQLHHNEVLLEATSVIKESNDDLITITTTTPILKSIIDSVPQLLSYHIIVCRPGVIISDISSPFRFVQRYCYALEVPLYDVGLNLEGYDVKWEPQTGMIWDSSIRQTIWNHTNFACIIIIADFYRSLSLLQYTGSKSVRYLCRELLTKQPQAEELTRVKTIA